MDRAFRQEAESEFGICDECGEYTPVLSHPGGEWWCPDCLNRLQAF